MVKSMKRALATVLAVALVMAPSMGVFATTTNNNSSAAVEAVVEEIPTTSSVAGVATTTPGVYFAKTVNGSAVTTPAATIATAFGLAKNEKAFTKVSDFNAKKSTAAAATINLVAASQKAVVGPMLNIEFGKMTAGKYSLLPKSGAIAMKLGLPASFVKAGATYAVVRVSAGGVFEIIPATVDAKGVLTFATAGGAGAYAIIRY